MKIFQRIFKWIYGLGRTPKNIWRLIVMPDAIDIFHGDMLIANICLQDVQMISAFKRDLGTVDLVCFQLSVGKGGTSELYEINEEMEGFESFIGRLEQYSGFDKEWRSRVIPLPFSPNRTVIFQRT